MGTRVHIPFLCLFLGIAFCNPARANTLENINNSSLRNYSLREIERGAPSLRISAKVLHREGLILLEQGKWEQAREKLILAAGLSGDYPDPLYTLARIELIHAHPDFLFHLIEGIKRQFRSFHGQAMLAANVSLMLVASLLVTLFALQVYLLIRYWPLFDHKLREFYSKRYAFPPQKMIGFLIILGLLIMRAGFAVYIALLIIILWNCVSRKEKGLLTMLVLLLAAGSFLAPRSRVLLPAVDERSITRRLSLVNDMAPGPYQLNSINAIDDKRFQAEKDFALGTQMCRLNRLEEAKNYLLSSVSQRDDFAAAYLNLGNVYFLQEDFNRALAGYQNVLSLDPTNALAHYNLGQTYINKMLFAQSSSALKKANELGLEQYRQTVPAIQFSNARVYDQGFSPADLWSIARREGGQGNILLLDEILRPWILFPFHRLWLLLIGALLSAVVLGRITPSSWKVSSCENCGQATCRDCVDTETGIDLCRDCSGVIKDLSSIKVMEALLRHKRQRIISRRSSRNRRRTMFLPGAAKVFSDKAWSGALILFINFNALLFLVWGGFYFSDPRGFGASSPLWKTIPPLVVMGAAILLTLRTKIPQETRNFRVLPAEFKAEIEEKEQREEKYTETPETVAAERNADDPFGAFLDSL